MAIDGLLKYRDDVEVDEEFWKELYVNYDLEVGKNSAQLRQSVSKKLYTIKKDSLIEIATALAVKNVNDELKKHEIIELILGIEHKTLLSLRLLLLFASRKERAIKKCYEERRDNRFANTSSQLIDLYEKDPFVLINIYTLYLWIEKNRGARYKTGKPIDLNKISRIITDEKTEREFIDTLVQLKDTSPSYKIHSYFMDSDCLIFNLYKQKSDEQKADFVKSIRSREPESILFSISKVEQTIEFKNVKEDEREAILNYFTENEGLDFKQLKTEVFNDYNPESVEAAFSKGNKVMKGDDQVDASFMVTELSFVKSGVSSSPELEIKLPNRSIAPAVADLTELGIITFKSIKDVKQIGVEMSGVKRTIKVISRPNGNVFLACSDGKMDEKKVKHFEQSFLGYFGLPLNQEISNTEFSVGKIEQIDYLMSLPPTHILTDNEQAEYNTLVDKQLIMITKKTFLKCPDCDELYETTDGDEDDSFGCDHEPDNFEEIEHSDQGLNHKKIRGLIEEELAKLFNEIKFEKGKASKIKLAGEQHEFIVYEDVKKIQEVQFLVVSNNPTLAIRRKLLKSLEPIILITVGLNSKEVTSLEEKGFTVISFGAICSEFDKADFDQKIKDVRTQLKTRVSKAADEAIKDIRRNVLSNNFTNYDHNDFEDDVYAILNDFIPNMIKWGKEKSGQEYPEGLLGVSYSDSVSKKSRVRRAFSYDCKLRSKSDKPYNLGSEEKKKAVNYIKFLNGNKFVKKFSDIHRLSSHIFIGNDFADGQKKSMQQYVSQNIAEQDFPKVSFFSVEALIRLHERYRDNLEIVERERALFAEYLVELLEKPEITNEEVDRMFEMVCDKDEWSTRKLPVEKVEK